MLKGLARWLRAAGHDTRVAPDGMPDRQVLTQALNDRRWLITRDAKLAEHRRADEVVVVLHHNDITDCAREVSRRLRVNWLAAPFTRCLTCNTPLVTAPDDRAERLREELKGLVGEVRLCPHCDQLYWAGGHVRRMRRRLENWQGGRFV
jgi:hypothetical protein